MAEEQEDLKIREEQDGSITVGGDEPPKEQEEDDRNVSHDDEEATDGETAEEAEERRERNRQRRKESKQRRNEYIDDLKNQIAARDSALQEMNQRLATVERRSTGSEMAQLEQAEKEANNYYNYYKDINSRAIATADGNAANDAQEKMFAARQRLAQINGIKKAMTQRQQQPQPLDPRVSNNAQEWMSRTKWYNPANGDEDTAVVLAIDNRLASEGWNPATKEYWDQLDKRLEKYLPHRYNQGYNKTQNSSNGGSKRSEPRSPVAGSGGESSGNRSNGYRLSPERVQAIKDAGKWDDPKARAAMIKRYQEFDKGDAQ